MVQEIGIAWQRSNILFLTQWGIRVGVHKRMEWNDHKGMENNEMYLSKGKEWKKMKWNGIE